MRLFPRLLIFSCLCIVFCDSGKAQSADPPNVIIIVVDDLGERDLPSYGNRFNETPTIDSLANTSFVFTNAYSASPVCSPSRASLLTGLHPASHGVLDYLKPNDRVHLDTTLFTLGDFYSSEGYRTGFIGKWHLSGYRINSAPVQTFPSQYGFDEFHLVENQGIGRNSYFYPYDFNKSIKNALGSEEFLVDRIYYEANKFIERNAGNPFFLMINHYAVHTDLQGKKEKVEYFSRKQKALENPDIGSKNSPHLAAQLSSIDDGVKGLLHLLEIKGLLQNTVIIVTSDNGGDHSVTDNFPYREGKSWLYEGGLRIPLIIHLPGYDHRMDISTPIVSYDLLPTLMALNGKTIIEEFDGISFADMMKNNKRLEVERDLFWIYPAEKTHPLGGGYSLSVLKDDYKLIAFPQSDQTELYNLALDPGECSSLTSDIYDQTVDSLGVLLFDKLNSFQFIMESGPRMGSRWEK